MKFDETMAAIFKVTDADEEQRAAIREHVTRLASTSNLAHSEAATAFYYAVLELGSANPILRTTTRGSQP